MIQRTVHVFCILVLAALEFQIQVSSFSLYSLKATRSAPASLSSSIHRRRRPNFKATILFSWQDRVKTLFFAKEETKKDAVDLPPLQDKDAVGTVIRLASKSYNKEHSKPSSREYTTRKEELSSIRVTKKGVEGDYNHYRTVALKSTKDRAISILTQDVMNSLRAAYKNYNINDGDLGENVLIDGVSFNYFQVGKKYKFSNGSDSKATVIVEITEPMEACANLCKLSYINDDSIQPTERIQRCQDFIEFLNRFDGYRGWYAKIHSDGEIGTGAIVSLLEVDED